ncbi:MAG: TetR family transcriptional regulator [Actinobacteria bacterium]|nr:TetR family transcriptional regulator [Actinomycetota bacterium]
MSASRSNRKEEILSAAIQLFHEQGYAGASMSGIARSVGILKGSLYHHFGSKEDLLAHVFAQATLETGEIMAEIEAMEAPPVTRIEAFVRAWSLWYLENLEMVGVYLSEWKHLGPARLGQALETRRGVFDRVEALIGEACDAGEAPVGLDCRYAAFYVLSVINGLPAWYRRGSADPPAVIAAVQAEMIGRMVRCGDGSHGGGPFAVEPERTDVPGGDADPRAELLAAATAAFHEEGYDRTSLQDIADRTSLFRGSLYHYMDSKEGLLAEIFERATAESFAVLAEIESGDCAAVDRLYRFVGSWSLWYLQNLEVVSVYVDEWRHLSGERHETAVATRRRAYEVVEGYVADVLGADAPEREARYAALLILAAINGLTGWYRPAGPDRPERIATAYAEMATALVVGRRAAGPGSSEA